MLALSGITINSNIAALKTQRALGVSSRSLTDTYSHLSSGLRISRASDDAAGLAISESLNVDSRVFAQGLRNISDGISAISIAEGAVQELSNIVMRQKELAEQAANGVYSQAQRSALNRESDSLTKEFNRIVKSTQFNDVNLLDLSTTNIRVQGGYGSSGGLGIGFGSELAHAVCAGTFAATMTTNTGLFGFNLKRVIDLNGDGNLDVIGSDSAGTQAIYTYLGDGGGNFSAGASYAVTSAANVVVGDINNDGYVDILANNSAQGQVLMGNADGSFSAARNAPFANSNNVILSDLNGDGLLDGIGSGAFGANIVVALANSNGSFKSQTFNTSSLGTPPLNLTIGDFNGDGYIDVAGNAASKFEIYFGNGNGSFKSPVSYAIGGLVSTIASGDINGDGIADLLVRDSTPSVRAFIGGANFTQTATISFPSSSAIAVTDINGDGNLDLINNGTTYSGVYFGNGDGTFQAGVSGGQSLLGGLLFGDINNDGATDILTSNSSGFRTHISDQAASTLEAPIDLTTQNSSRSALTILTRALSDIDSELGSLGSFRSRLDSASSILAVSRENYLAARSQILDADVAEESAKMVRTRILQQAGAAVLAQANREPEIALQLIGQVR